MLPKRHINGGFVQVQDIQATNSYKRNGIRRNSLPTTKIHLLRYQCADRFQCTSWYPRAEFGDQTPEPVECCEFLFRFAGTQVVREPEDAS